MDITRLPCDKIEPIILTTRVWGFTLQNKHYRNIKTTKPLEKIESTKLMASTRKSLKISAKIYSQTREPGGK